MDQSSANLPLEHGRPLWDVFCHVVDNLGDIGVCWRLALNLADRGQRVRLWIDQPEPLQWMAPGALEGHHPWVEVLPWTTPLPTGLCDLLEPAQVWVEAFGCHPPDEAQNTLAARLAEGLMPPVWINLEYLSAESYVERSHGLPSLVSSGPLKGVKKWFFYPGFTQSTGGLLREADLFDRLSTFDEATWVHRMGLLSTTAKRISVFCYEPPSLSELIRQVSAEGSPTDWLVASGRSAHAMQAAWADIDVHAAGHVHFLPLLAQKEFDHLLWSSDLNLVRGEDSLTRAIWAGKPFVWHTYPQDDNAHHTKLNAFLDWLEAPESLRRFHHVWNGMRQTGPIWPGWGVISEWQTCVLAARNRLLAQRDLCSQILEFVHKSR